VYEDGFSSALRERLAHIESDIANIINTEVAKFEGWQATNYQQGEQFDFHLDAGVDFSKQFAGDRVRSIILYLESPDEGGETHFRALNIRIRPEMGKLVIWKNLLPSGFPDFAMIHAGMPVLKGSKTILVTWERKRIHRMEQSERTEKWTKTRSISKP
jgi:prolyl 4-hydroxylase